MFSKVLVGVDLRQGGRDAVALASQLRDPEGTIALEHVYPGTLMPSHALCPGLVREERRRAETQLEHARAAANIQAELIVTQGPSPGQVLHETAEERTADLLVLGSCHRGVLGRAMLGDDTRAAINGAPCAVAVAPAGFAECPKPISTIGVAYDGSPESERALDVARAVAARGGATIRALHIVSIASYAYSGFGGFAMPAVEAVEEADARMKALDGVEGRAQLGFAEDDLAVFSKNVDLLVVGSRGYGPLGRLVHGSTSSRLARHARAPLLIVPRISHQLNHRDTELVPHIAITAST
jgi:nucleotide-binding universal stress UspA family protein